MVGHDTLVGGQDDVAKLTGGENASGEVLEVLELQVETRRDHTAFVETAVQINDNFARAGIVNDRE